MNKDNILSKRDFKNLSIKYKDLPELEQRILEEAWQDNPDVDTQGWTYKANETVSFDWYHVMFDWIAENPDEFKQFKSEAK